MNSTALLRSASVVAVMLPLSLWAADVTGTWKTEFDTQIGLQKYITSFVLRYRLVETKTDDPVQEVMSRGNLDSIVKPIIPLAMAPNP
jgi:hypothetical protein